MKIYKMNRFKILIFSVISLFALDEIAFAKNQCDGGGMLVRFDLSKTNNDRIDNQNTYIVVLGIDPKTKNMLMFR